MCDGVGGKEGVGRNFGGNLVLDDEHLVNFNGAGNVLNGTIISLRIKLHHKMCQCWRVENVDYM